MSSTATPVLTSRFFLALTWAFQAHSTQTRKAGGRNKSYFGTHLMGVSSYVQELGGDEDDAIAAILHDIIEDQLDNLFEILWGGNEYHGENKRDFCYQRIYEEFGLTVRQVVEHMTDDKLPKEWKTMPREWRLEWLEKSNLKKCQKLLEMEGDIGDRVRRVKGCDVLYNLRSLLQDRVENGPNIWKAFAPGFKGTLSKYENLTRVFEEKGPAIAAIELRGALNRLREVCQYEANLR